MKPGEFSRPNGIWIEGDILYVVERDNRRVQVLTLPDFSFRGFIGEGQLHKPYGIYVQPLKENIHRVYVSDNYDRAHLKANQEGPPATAPSDYSERVRLFHVVLDREAARTASDEKTSLPSAFGETQGPGVLEVVESLHGDTEYNRLLVSDEDSTEHNIKIYTLSGDFTGEIIGEGIFRHEPEGIALYERNKEEGLWICTDQGPRKSIFHVFDRETLEYRGSFHGRYTANTDGICLSAHSSRRYPAGVLYAVDDDQRVAAFSWEEVLSAMDRGGRSAAPDL
jgi:3-phytase